MQIGTFRRNVTKTVTTRATKTALKMVAKNTARTNIAHAAVALKGNTGRLLQVLTQYLLGLPLTQEMKDESFTVLGDIGFDLVALSRALKVRLPSSTKKSRLMGTRGAAIMQLDSLATNLLLQVEQGLFAPPAMVAVKKMVTLPLTGVKEERDGVAVDAAAEQLVEAERQTQMRSFVSGAIDVYWRLVYSATDRPPVWVLGEKFKRMQAQYPHLTFDMGEKKPKPVGAAVAEKIGKKPKAEEPVTA